MSMSHDREGQAEAQRTDCFLCFPREDLVFDRCASGIAFAGLGPITDGYSIVATPRHVRYLSELSWAHLVEYLQFIEKIRSFLEGLYGSCLITEHGNTAFCADYSAGHPFHPHSLMFPRAKSILASAIEYFKHYEQVSTLLEVVKIAGQRQYLLASPNSREYYVFFPANGMPRQFARALVAEQCRQPELASWRDHPNLDRALRDAAAHRDLLKD